MSTFKIAIMGIATILIPAVDAYAQDYTVAPSVFVGTAEQCGGVGGTPGGVTAEWVPDVGNTGFALFLAKDVATTDCSAAGADIEGVAGDLLTELSFEYKGYCSAGSPRFNVFTTAGTYYFFGCTYGTHTATDNGYTLVQFGNADAFPADGVTPFPGFGNTTLTGLEIVFDEQGQVLLDNIRVNGQTITGPFTEQTKELCKNGGYTAFTTAPGPFKNQGQCVSYFSKKQGGAK